MNQSQIDKFIKKVAFGTEIPIRVARKGEISFRAIALKDGIIYDRYYCISKRRGKYYFKYLLMHEVGHYFACDGIKSKVEREYLVQQWAIIRAEQLGWYQIAKELKKWMIRWLGETKPTSYKWDTNYRRYIIAARIAREDGWFKEIEQ